MHSLYSVNLVFSDWLRNESTKNFIDIVHLFHDPEDVGNLISGSSAFSKTSLNIWNFTVHVIAEAWLGKY